MSYIVFICHDIQKIDEVATTALREYWQGDVIPASRGYKGPHLYVMAEVTDQQAVDIKMFLPTVTIIAAENLPEDYRHLWDTREPYRSFED